MSEKKENTLRMISALDFCRIPQNSEFLILNAEYILLLFFPVNGNS